MDRRMTVAEIVAEIRRLHEAKRKILRQRESREVLRERSPITADQAVVLIAEIMTDYPVEHQDDEIKDVLATYKGDDEELQLAMFKYISAAEGFTLDDIARLRRLNVLNVNDKF